jgi:hypothetical protein
MVLVFLERFDRAECKSIDSNRWWSYLVQDHDQEGCQRPNEQGCHPPKKSAAVFALRQSCVDQGQRPPPDIELCLVVHRLVSRKGISNRDVHCGFTICLNVKLIRSSTGSLVLGTECCQCCCIVPAMMISVPWPARNVCVFRERLCLMRNFLVAPSESESMILPISGSSSACHPMLSWPSLYRFRRQ